MILTESERTLSEAEWDVALVQTRRAEALSGFRHRVASAREKETPGEAPGVEVFALAMSPALAASKSYGFEIRC